MAIYRGTVGLRINVTVLDDAGAPFDISGANGTFSLEAEKPDGEELSWTITVISGPAGTCYYDTVATDLDEEGTVVVQGKWVPTAGGAFYTSPFELEVLERAQ